MKRRKRRPFQMKDFLLPQLAHYEEGNTTMDDGTHEQGEGGRHDVQEEEVVAGAVLVLHNDVMEGNSPAKADVHDDDNDHRGNRALFHSAFERSPLSQPVLMATRKVASLVSSFLLLVNAA